MTTHGVTEAPWHLIPQDIRERSAIANLERDATGGHSCEGPFGERAGGYTGCDCHLRAEAFRAAAKLLRDAAPYPDEALVFEVTSDVLYQGEHGELVGWSKEWAWLRWPLTGSINSLTLWVGWQCIRPLTIAAHEALEILAVRSRTP